MCDSVMVIPHVAAWVPRFKEGIAHGSTRKLLLPEKESPAVRERIPDKECSLSLSATTLSILHDICSGYGPLRERQDLMDGRTMCWGNHGTEERAAT